MMEGGDCRRTFANRQLSRAVMVLPDCFVVVLAAAVLLGELSALLGLRPLASPWGSRLFLGSAAALTASVGWAALRRRVPMVPSENRYSWAPLVPALMLVGYAVFGRLLPLGERVEWFLGGDHVRHLVFVAEEQAVGNLSYGEQSYPRAWHTLMAAVWSSMGGRIDQDGLRLLVDVLAGATWCLPAVLSIGTGALTVGIAQRLGLPTRSGTVAGLLAAALVLWPPFLSVYQALGFENSLVGAIVLAAVARRVLEPPDHALRSLTIVLCGVVVCAHTWQLLLPALGIALLQQGSLLVRSGQVMPQVLGVLASLAAALVALPGLLAVLQDVGIEHATDAGVEAPVPVLLLLIGLLASAGLAVRYRGDRNIIALAVITVVPALTAVGVALWVGVGLSVYYPSKLLWHSAVLGLPSLVIVAVMAWSLLARRSTGLVAASARAVGMASAALVVAHALITPAGAFLGAWSTVRGPQVVAAITAPNADSARVVWLGAIGDDTISRILLDFYRVDRTRERTPQPPLSVAEECDLLRATTRPAVLSSASPDQVRTRYVCVPEVHVVPVWRPISSH